MLAEGDVDPAAGSRDEPTRLYVEARERSDLDNVRHKRLDLSSSNQL